VASSLLKQFLKNSAGNFSLIGGVMTTSAVSIVGLGIDMQRNYAIKSSLQSAVDAAALSGALTKTSLGKEATFGERRKAALQSLNNNVENLDLIEQPNITIDPFTGTITVEAHAKTDYLIMSLFGHENKILSAQGKAAYVDAADNSDDIRPGSPIVPDSGNEAGDGTSPISIAFVLDNSTSLLNEFTGDLTRGNTPPIDVFGGLIAPPTTGPGGGASAGNAVGAGGGAGGSSMPITRLDLIKDAADEFYSSLDAMARTNPTMRQNIRTALMPFNDGLDRRYEVGLQPGWARTAAQTKNMQPKRRKLPVESFQSAVTQLNNDRKTTSSDARKAIVFMGDGKFDIGFDRTTETQRLIETCQQAKADGIEIYVLALEASKDTGLNPYQLCASPNGSISGYGANQAAIDQACALAFTAPLQTQCRAQKSEYFSEVISRADLDQFWARLNPTRRPAPDPETENSNANNNSREASVRLVE